MTLMKLFHWVLAAFLASISWKVLLLVTYLACWAIYGILLIFSRRVAEEFKKGTIDRFHWLGAALWRRFVQFWCFVWRHGGSSVFREVRDFVAFNAAIAFCSTVAYVVMELGIKHSLNLQLIPWSILALGVAFATGPGWIVEFGDLVVWRGYQLLLPVCDFIGWLFCIPLEKEGGSKEQPQPRGES